MEKRVLITGAAIRIGRLIALSMAQMGWDIALHYRTSQGEAQALAQTLQYDMGRSVWLAKADLEDEKAAKRLIPSLPGPITALIHNASLFLPDTKDPDGKRHHSVNVTAPLILNEAFLAQLPQGVQGTIIQILDATPIPPQLSAYANSRRAMESLLPELTKRYAPRARMVGLALGPLLKNDRQSQAHFDALRAQTPNNVPTTPQALHERLITLL